MPSEGLQVQAIQAQNQQINTNAQQQEQEQNLNQRNLNRELPQEAAHQERQLVTDPLEHLEPELQRLSKEEQASLLDVVAAAQEMKELDAKIQERKNDPAHTEKEMNELKEIRRMKYAVLQRIERKLYNTRTELSRKQLEYNRLYARLMRIQETDESLDEAEELSIERQIEGYELLKKEKWSSVLDVNQVLNGLYLRREVLQNRRTLRDKLTTTAKSMAEMAKEYKESGFGDVYDEMSGADLLTDYVNKAEAIWNDEKLRQEYLSGGFITEHLVQSLSILDLAKKFQSKRESIHIPAHMRERLRKADRILAYYRAHVNTVLVDYGMSLDQLTYSEANINRIVKGEKRYYQKERWENDYVIYEELEGRKQDLEGVDDTRSIRENRLRILERMAGINLDDDTDLINTVYDEKESEQYQEQVERKGTGYLRLKADYQLTNGDYKRLVNKEARLLAVSQSFIWKLKEEGVWKEDSDFAKIPKLILDYMETYRNQVKKGYTDYTQIETLYRNKLKNVLDRISLTGKGFREKQFASMIREYLSQDEDGRINMPSQADQNYRVEDRYFKNMNTVIKDSKGRKCIDRFRSVREEPLFPHDPTLRDLTQGAAGDCFFIAALASIVAREPDLIKRMMQDNGDGTVTVNFYHDAGTKSTIQVRVDKTIPERHYVSEELNVDSFSRGALWVKMMEKAYAAVREKNMVRNPNNANDGMFLRSDPAYAYKNLDGGSFAQAMQELTGDVTATSEHYELGAMDVKMFRGRLDEASLPTLGKKKLNTPSLLYFQKRHMHDKNNKAFLYLAGDKTLPGSSTRVWKEELKQYEFFENAMSDILEYREGVMEIRAMDNKNLAAAIGRLMIDIEKYTEGLKPYTGEELDEEKMKNANVPEEMYEAMPILWEKAHRNAAEMQRIFLGIGGEYKRRLEKEIIPTGYTAKEEQLYGTIQSILRNGGTCSIGTRNFQSDNLTIRGTMGEDSRGGIFGEHAYAILGTQEIRVGNQVKKFLQMFNPHGSSIPLYQVDEEGRLKRVPLENSAMKKGGAYETATHGVFLLELRDAGSVMDVLFRTGSL